MLINLRNALMTGKRLPYDAEVEYLESTGMQWIDTGVYATENTRVKIAFSDYTQSGAWLFGARRGFQNAALGIYTNANTAENRWLRAFGNFISSGFTFSTVDLGVSTFDYDCGHFTGTREKVPITVKFTDTASAFDSSPYNIYLWTVNLAGTPGAISSAKIYATQIWQNGVLVRDFIPVRKGSTGYLYDRVSGKLFGNAGTGDFVLGPDVVPVEWLGCDGSQYIDTKVVATDSHGFRVDIEAAKKTVDVNTRIFGAHEGNVRCGFALYGEPPSDDYFWVWNEATGFRATIPQRFVVSLNYKNDRAAIFNGTTNLSQLGTLGSMTQSVYLLNANYGNAPFANQFVVGKFYGAEITVGSDVVNHYIPVRVGTEGAMMDTLTRRIYRNQGTGAFTYGNDLKYPIPAS